MRTAVFVLVVVAAGCQQPQPTAQPPSNTSAIAQLPAAQQAAVKQAKVTVLVPPVAQPMAESNVAVQDTHYSLTQPATGLTMSLTGSVATVRRPESGAIGPPPAAAGTVRGVPVYVSENEGIKTATWIENGTAYALDLECASADDKRCVSSDYILDLVRSLVNVTQQVR